MPVAMAGELRQAHLCSDARNVWRKSQEPHSPYLCSDVRTVQRFETFGKRSKRPFKLVMNDQVGQIALKLITVKFQVRWVSLVLFRDHALKVWH